ncbi:AIPR family protein [Alcanivorax sp. IL3]|uniref:AIPR family protein n=1 Tax=Alcanivorax sp. IL3 TaxID=3396309 RepID=UPI000C6018F4|nr:hypothetical protein [Alcanivorax sp.]|tara:strand:+ start:4739 stop:6775 length:2037 start_codon:yes stop_codon:yes gene_type:complete
MAIEIQEFYEDLKSQLDIAAGSEGQFLENQFSDYYSEYVMGSGDLDGFENCYIKMRGVKVNGYFFSGDDGVLNLITSDFRNTNNIESLTNTDISEGFKRLASFYDQSSNGRMLDKLEETSDAYELADLIFDLRDSILRVRLFVFSDAVLTKQFKQIPDKNLGGVLVTHSIWDLGRLHRLALSSREREDIEINIGESGYSIHCLPGPQVSDACKSWVSILPGEYLAKLYDFYGARLLEQNVRNFLQVRSKVNKGIRNTLLNEPEMFLAYNNGISATAEEVYTESSTEGTSIVRLKNFQIVNGGQTTASIYSAWKRDKVDLSNIQVQMKVTQIAPERVTEVVPLISRYSNSQNPVSEADFFSNHPFHVRIQELSQRIWAPPLPDSQTQTKWFYERTRGQYLDQQAYLTASKKKQFKMEYPRAQMFSKTDLAKYLNSWAMKPHVVSLGAQKNFARFANDIAVQWEKDDTVFSESYYRDLVSKAIIFKSTERIVSSAPWYQGGYRANIVTYAIALIASRLGREGLEADFNKIWSHQGITNSLGDIIARIAEKACDWLTDTPSQISNVTEYAKREFCWKNFEGSDVVIDALGDQDWVLSKGSANERRQNAKRQQRIDNQINAQIEVYNRGAEFWKSVAERGLKMEDLTPKEMDILAIATQIPAKNVSEKQSKLLLEIARRLGM